MPERAPFDAGPVKGSPPLAPAIADYLAKKGRRTIGWDEILACAFAEAVWTAPAAPGDYADFVRRMAVHRKRLIAAGVSCAPLE